MFSNDSNIQPAGYWKQAEALQQFNWADTPEGWRYWKEEFNRLAMLAGRSEEVI